MIMMGCVGLEYMLSVGTGFVQYIQWVGLNMVLIPTKWTSFTLLSQKGKPATRKPVRSCVFVPGRGFHARRPHPGCSSLAHVLPGPRSPIRGSSKFSEPILALTVSQYILSVEGIDRLTGSERCDEYAPGIYLDVKITVLSGFHQTQADDFREGCWQNENQPRD